MRIFSKSECISLTGESTEASLSEVASSLGGNSPRADVEVHTISAKTAASTHTRCAQALPVGRINTPLLRKDLTVDAFTPFRCEEGLDESISPTTKRARRRRRQRGGAGGALAEAETPTAMDALVDVPYRHELADGSPCHRGRRMRQLGLAANSESPQRQRKGIAAGAQPHELISYSASPVRVRRGLRGIMSTDMTVPYQPNTNQFGMDMFETSPVVNGDASTRAPPSRGCLLAAYCLPVPAVPHNPQQMLLCPTTGVPMGTALVDCSTGVATPAVQAAPSMIATNPGRGAFLVPVSVARHDLKSQSGDMMLGCMTGEDLAAQLRAAAPDSYED